MSRSEPPESSAIRRSLCDRRGFSAALLVLCAALLHPYAVGRALDPMEQLRDPRLILLVLAGEGGMVLAALVLLAWRRLPWPRPLARTAVAALAALIAFGAWANALYLEWLRPAVRTPEQLQAWLTSESEVWSLRGIQRLQRELAEDRAAGDAREVLRTGLELADQQLWHGRNDEALATLAELEREARAAGLDERDLAPLQRAYGVAWMRKGETSHCVVLHNRESCILPIQGGGVWSDPAPAQEAIRRFGAALRGDPSDLSSRWLINLAAMVAGEHPQAVPPEHLISFDVFRAPEEFPAFRDLARELGLDRRNVLGGAAMDDFDGDGLLDVVASSNHPAEGMIYMRNDGRGGFEDRSEASGLARHCGAFNFSTADFDNDGRLDLYLIRGAWARHFGRQRNTLLRQRPDGTFEDVTVRAGMAGVAYPNLAAPWADADGDGDLDLFVGGMRLSDAKVAPSQLYRNDGDGTFAEVASAAGVRDAGEVTSAAWGDYDNDGDEDLFVANLRGPERLYRNDGGLEFSDVAAAAGVAEHPPKGRTFASWFWDYDNDGWLDLFVGDYGAWDLGAAAADYLGAPSDRVERSRLYRNRGDGRLEDVSAAAGVDRVWMPMAANHGDFDNDGRPDCYLATGAPALGYLMPNVMLWNRGGRFADVTFASRTGHLQKGHGVAIGDLDNDGDQDIFEDLGGLYPSDVMSSALYENPGFGNHWLTLRLIGRRANRSAIGARLKVSLDGPDGPRELHFVVGTGGSFGCNSLQAELGLGSAASLRRLEVAWPGSGTRQVFENVAADRFLELEEGAEELRVVEKPRIRLAPALD